jgi:hypothetical protein
VIKKQPVSYGPIIDVNEGYMIPNRIDTAAIDAKDKSIAQADSNGYRQNSETIGTVKSTYISPKIQ